RELVLGDEAFVEGGADDGRGHCIDPDPVRGQLHGQVTGESVQAALGQRVPRGRGGGDGLVGPHAADVDDGPALAARDHAAGHGLGDEEDRPVQLEVGVVGGAVVVQERLGDEEARRVDQQGGVGVLVGQLPAYPFDLPTIGQVGGDTVGLAVLAQCLDGVVDLAGVLSDDDGGAAGGHDVGGGLASHPAAAADDYQFLPGEDGHGRRPVGLVRVTVQVPEPV